MLAWMNDGCGYCGHTPFASSHVAWACAFVLAPAAWRTSAAADDVVVAAAAVVVVGGAVLGCGASVVESSMVVALNLSLGRLVRSTERSLPESQLEGSPRQKKRFVLVVV